MKILILHASKKGQTEKIAHFIAESVQNHGHQTTIFPVNRIPDDFSTDAYDAVIIGGPIYIGRYPSYLQEFVTTHRDWLNRVPSAFFTVCMAIHSKNSQEQEQARSFGINFIKKTNWHTNMMETFAGAIKYTQYGFITRMIMRNIARKEGGDTDTSRDHEYTDWNAVTRFTEQFLKQVKQNNKND